MKLSLLVEKLQVVYRNFKQVKAEVLSVKTLQIFLKLAGEIAGFV
jgi:hypothetical protein